MKSRDFSKYLAVYGADLNQWPAALRQEAETALKGSGELQELLASEQQFEVLLQQRTTAQVPAGLAERIVAQAQPHESQRALTVSNGLLENLWAPRWVMAMVAVFAVGLFIGWYSPQNGGTSESDSAQLSDILYYEEGGL